MTKSESLVVVFGCTYIATTKIQAFSFIPNYRTAVLVMRPLLAKFLAFIPFISPINILLARENITD